MPFRVPSDTTATYNSSTGEFQLTVDTDEISDSVIEDSEYTNERLRLVFENGDLKVKRHSLHRGKSIEKFDHDSMRDWYTEEAIERFGNEEMGRIYAGLSDDVDTNGVAALKQAVNQDAAGDIADTIERVGGDYVTDSFNKVTSSWPTMARARLAGYVARENGPGSGDDLSEAEDYSKSYDVYEVDMEQTELTFFYEDNPFEDERLTEEQARAVNRLRASGYSVDDIDVEELEDTDAFFAWLDELSDPKAAIECVGLDPTIPNPVARRADPVSEWDPDPEHVNTRECGRCGDQAWRVESDGEETWIDRSGNETEFYRSGPGQQYRFAPDFEPSSPYLCATCAQYAANGGAKLIFSDGDNLYCIVTEGDVFSDHSFVDDRFDTLNRSLTGELREMYDAAVNNGNSHVPIQPNPDVIDEDELNTQLIEMANDPGAPLLEEGVVLSKRSRSFGTPVASIHVPKDNVAAARNIKEHLATSA